jgi:hypothetical protein
MQTRIHKNWQILAFSLGVMAIGACTPPPVERIPDPEPPPTPPPAVTPHPAASAQERAVQLYPDLAVKDSLFNRTFLELVEQTKTTNPRMLTMVDWPIHIAHQAAGMLGVQPMPERSFVTAPPTPVPVTPLIIQVTPKLGSSLDKGAYNSMRGVAKTPELRYVYPQ